MTPVSYVAAGSHRPIASICVAGLAGSTVSTTCSSRWRVAPAGVRYERPYVHDTVDARHAQYRPDFYYPQVDAWHEHWALDRQGNPPASFIGYADSMRWKKELHRSHGTTLIETTTAGVMDRGGLADLAAKLRSLGLTLDWNQDRQIRGEPPVKHEDLARLVRTFMTHVKSNSLTEQDQRARAGDNPRTRLFLDLYWRIHAAWNMRLAAEECIDFEDMLVQAAEHLEEGRYRSPFELVMVDEFQDASQARARLTRALVDTPGRYLLAVGDDWQSINRFAGADLSVLTDFKAWFGNGPTLRLQTTFRCDQAIVDTASAFIAKNPRQLPKQVTSVHHGRGPGVRVARVPSKEAVPAAVGGYLHHLRRELIDGLISPGRDGRLSVDILGRYKFDCSLKPARDPAGLDVTFRTIHSAKGLEADYILLPNMTNGTFGFPSQIADDPVLNIVMADPDDYQHAEERRLFYVALTRARRGVLLITPTGVESPFIAELLKDGLAVVESDQQSPKDIGTSAPTATVCPGCGTGLLTVRSGRHGPFMGCGSFPKCRYTTPIRQDA